MSIVQESDGGTKAACQRALTETQKELSKQFEKAAKDYWWKVWQTARMLCIEYGAIDTWTMYNSIRLLWNAEPYGGLYEVAISAEAGVTLTAMIKVGGMGYINPKTGYHVDYAQVVHDGYPAHNRPPKPFLTDAIIQCESYREQLFTNNIDRALAKFERDY